MTPQPRALVRGVSASSLPQRRFVMVAPNSEPDSGSKVSPRKRRANRRNARKSTGPRSPEGKQRSSRNAVTHGIFAQIVLDGESDPLFAIQQHAYVERLRPQDRVELDLVNRIAICQWRI